MPVLPIFAIDFGQVVGLIILVLSVLSWFVNVVKGNGEQPAAPKANPRPPRPKDERVRQEIEDFLQEVLKQPGRPQGEPKQDTARKGQPAPARAANQQATRPKGQVKQNKGNKGRGQQPAKRPTELTFGNERPPVATPQLPMPHLASSNLGESIRGSSLKHLEPNALGLDKGVAGVVGTTAASPQSAIALRSLFGDRDDMRRAILIQEVLGRPLALRR
jgi:hypothetical protein